MKIIPIATSNGTVASGLLSCQGSAFCSAELKTLHA